MIFFSCRKTSLLIARGEFEDGKGLTKALAWLHLLYCRHCRKFRRQMRILGAAARIWAGGFVSTEALEQKLIQRLT